MGIADTGLLGANFIMKFKVDTSEAKAALKDLTGAEKQAAQAALRMAEERNKSLDRWSKGIGGVAVGVQLATKAIQFAGEAWKSYEKAALAAGGADAEKAKQFRQAFNVYDSAIERFKIGVGGMVAELGPLLTALGGIVDVAGGIAGIARGLASFVATGSVSGNNWNPDNDSLHGFSSRDLLNEWLEKRGWAPNGLDTSGLSEDSSAAVTKRLQEIAGHVKMLSQWEDDFQAQQEDSRKAALKRWADHAKAMEDARKRAENAGFGLRYAEGTGGVFQPGMADLDPTYRDRRYNELFEQRRGKYLADQEFAAIGGHPGGALGAQQQEEARQTLEYLRGMGPAVESLTSWADSFGNSGRASMLEQIFGPLDEFSAYQTGIDLLAESWSAATGALREGFDLWVDGGNLTKKAMKELAAESLKGIASFMWAESLKQGGLAVAALAIQNYDGATKHGIAAGLLSAGAVSVGSVARQMGGSGAAAGRGYGAYGGAPSVTGGARSSASERPVVIILGDSMSDDSPTMRAKAVGRALNRADRYRDNSVEWS